VHSYRHRFGLVAGDPRVAEVEAAIAKQPAIGVPTIHLDGLADGVASGRGAASGGRFSGEYEYRAVAGAGHNLPQEAPVEFASAVVELL